MNKLLILCFMLLAIFIFCGDKSEYFTQQLVTKCKQKGITHHRQFSFLPYYTKNVKNMGKRGCHTDKYWDCVYRHPTTIRNGNEITPNDITPEVHEQCVKQSNGNCEFPELLSHSRTEPYYQTIEYA